MEDRMVKVTARIMGEEYVIRGRAPQEHIERIARYVDEKMNQIAETYPKLGTSRVAVLSAINMADELFKIKEQYEQLTRLLEEEWSQRHTAAAADRPAAAAARPAADRVPLDRLPAPGRGPASESPRQVPPARENAPASAPSPARERAAGHPNEVQLSAFGEPVAPSLAPPEPEGQLLTGDALTKPRPDWEPEDEDQ